jgi:hypothetical protein
MIARLGGAGALNFCVKRRGAAVDWIDRLADYWGSQGLLHRQQPTRNEVDDFERRFAVSLPHDLREYFLRLNGTAGGQFEMADDELIAFWRLDQVATLAAECTVGFAEANDWFVFADYSIWCHAYAVRLSSDRRAGAPVAICHNPLTYQVAPSMAQFIDAYLRRDYSILFAAPPHPLAGDASP